LMEWPGCASLTNAAYVFPNAFSGRPVTRTFSAIDALHTQTPLRVWSVIVTIFGDVVMRGGTDLSPPPVWIGALQQLLELLGVDSGLARTSLSRLVANGTLVRAKTGRNTFYRLSETGSTAFADAADLIYGRKPKRPTGRFHAVLLDRCHDRPPARARLLEQGFRLIGPTVAIAPEFQEARPFNLPADSILSIAESSSPLAAAAADVWQLAALNGGYGRFIETFSSLRASAITEPAVAIAARIVLVHQFRRLALRDPMLPPAALPADWAGIAARTLFDRTLIALESYSEAWVETAGLRTPDP
jgi:phenylacetic acid degradation operon negative regulatory protein